MYCFYFVFCYHHRLVHKRSTVELHSSNSRYRRIGITETTGSLGSTCKKVAQERHVRGFLFSILSPTSHHRPTAHLAGHLIA